VLKDLGERGITSVLIEGGGEVLGEALDKRLIDKVQIYLGPILTGGPVVAFPGAGAGKTADALRLSDIEYEQIDQTVSLKGYPDLPTVCQ
jgi:diaminohydroxyphosphoribosylaminopyrimidine deaminase/5-amino-6-(5-phosphoribosylamino)uracil reductase